MKKFILGIFILLIVIVPCIVYGIDDDANFEKIAPNGVLTINTNQSYTTNEELAYLVNSSKPYINNLGSSYFDVSNCDKSTMECDLSLNEYTETGFELIKSKRISVVINDDVDEVFSNITTTDELNINIDSSIITNQNEWSLLSNYFESYNYTSDGINVNYSYDKGNKLLRALFHDFNKNITTHYFKTISDVNYVYDEDSEISDDFNLLLDNNKVVIYSDSKLPKDILLNYLGSKVNNKFRITIDEFKGDNQAYIRIFSPQTPGPSEVHLVDLEYINEGAALFNKFKITNNVDILFDNTFMNDESISNLFTSLYNINYTEDDGKMYYYVSGSYFRDYSVYPTTYEYYVKIDENNNENNTKKSYIKKVNINKVSDGEKSDLYSEIVPNPYIVNTNILDVSSLNNSLSQIRNKYYDEISGLKALTCNNDFSKCLISLTDNNFNIEQHFINVSINKEISQAMKQAFNLTEDNKLRIRGEFIDTNWLSLYKYYDGNSLNVNFDTYNKQFTLTLNNYLNNYYESKLVDYETVDETYSKYYLDTIGREIDCYPGELEVVSNYDNNYDYTKSITLDSLVRSTLQTYNESIVCNFNDKICNIAIFNDENILETHNVKINIKSGYSDDINELFPSDRIKVKAIDLKDNNKNKAVLFAYFSSISKGKWVDIVSLEGDTVRVIFNGHELKTFKIEYQEADKKILDKVNKYIDKIVDNKDKSIIIDDMNFVSDFYYKTQTRDIDFLAYNSKDIYEYIQNIVHDKHINYMNSGGGGGGGPFSSGFSASPVLTYDGVAYGVTESMYDENINYSSINIAINNIIYVPNNISESNDEIIRYIQDRINANFGENSGMFITNLDENSDEDKEIENIFEDELDYLKIDKTKVINKPYKLVYGKDKAYIVVIRDTSKMKKINFLTTDPFNNVSIKSNDANLPNDTIVQTDVISKDSEKYKDILEKLGLKDALVYDFKLYSNQLGAFIEDYSGEDVFNVSVPLTEELLNSNDLIVYYVHEDGTIDEKTHPVSLDEFLATFDTTHFSTYVIGSKTDDIDNSNSIINNSNVVNNVDNPKTFDNILNYFVLFIISIIGMTFAIKYLKKKN